MHRIARSLSALSLSLAIALAMTACGGGGGSGAQNNLSEQQASQAFDSMATALDTVTTDAQNALDEQGGSGSVSVTGNCTSGGGATAQGDFVVGRSFSLDIDFNGCVESGVRIDGGITYEATGDSTSATVTVTGRLTFAGAITGTCDVDATLVVTASSATVHGTVCGIDVSGTATDPTRK